MADRRHQDNGQGDVKNPETDGRLKQNRDGGGMSANMGRDRDDDDSQRGHGQGRVTDPAHDGRLKQNR